MIKRLHIYFKERYPIIPRIILGIILFLEIHFIILLNMGVTWKEVHLGPAEATGAFTCFAFLLWLRIADDLKDFETDKKLFPDRPLPSGRVFKKDVMVACVIVQVIAIALNVLFMRENLIFLVILYIYGYLMSKWFFKKKKIQPSLPLALITHNPVQAFINLYIIAFTIQKYQLPFFSLLIWEVSRKIRAPKDETEYTTYSKLFGYKDSTKFVLILTILDIITNFILVWNLNKISVGVLFLLVSWMTWKFIQFIKNPERFVLVEKVELYTYLQESTMLLTIVCFIIFGKI